MNKKFKFLTVLLALVMTLGAFAPFGAVKAADETTDTVTIHKILMDRSSFDARRGKINNVEFVIRKTVEKDKTTGTETATYEAVGATATYTQKQLEDAYNSGVAVFAGEIGVNNEKYTGKSLGDADAIKAYFGGTSKEIEGVYFAWAKKDTDGKYYWIKSDGSFTTTKTEVNEKELDKLPADTFGGETVKDSGKTFTTTNFKGEYKIYEIHAKSTYFNNSNAEDKKGNVLTDMKAVPVVITLPLVNNDGVVKNAHVYPKNTEDKPKIDKNFAKEHKLEEYVEKEANKTFKEGAQYKNYDKDKATAKVKIGDEIPYEVKTEIPAKSHLGEAHWNDRMTEGLTYNTGSLTITVDGKALIKDTDYSLKERKDGFDLNLLKSGLDKINGKEAAVTVVLTYKATVNEKAKADIEDSNDVTFHYGNTPGHGNTPVPNKPDDNGKVTITKNWDTGVTKQDVTFTLYNANTGKEVKATDLVGPTEPVAPVKPNRDDYKDEEQYNKAKTQYDADLAQYNAYQKQYEKDLAVFEAYKTNEFKNPITIKSGETMTHTWKYLNKNYEYKVIETFINGYSVEYDKTKTAGGLTATNYKSDNPKPLNPTEPKVITGGKRFVKTNDEVKDSTELKRLAGAEFYVKNAKNEYLVAAKKDASKVTAAKEALDKAVENYNKLSAEDQKGQKGTDAKKAIDTAQEAYNKAFKENATAYTWGAKDDPNVVVLTSDGQGRFEITGLAYGTYYLEEKTPPAGYAKRNDTPEFEVKKGSYDGSDKELKYNIEVKQGEKVVYGQQVKNKKVSIPETGGIGTVIFTVVGVMLMVGAAFALKRRKEDELEGLA